MNEDTLFWTADDQYLDFILSIKEELLEYDPTDVQDPYNV